MFQFPSFPDTLVTRQIECVSCKEIFTVAEDYAAVKDERSDHWRMPSENPSHTEMNHNSEIMRQRVYPLPRQTPGRAASSIPTWNDSLRTYVNCPRCGADNRNWVRLAYAPPSASFFQTLRQRLQRYGLVVVGLLISLGLAGALILKGVQNEHLTVYIPMIIAVLLVGLIPILSITGQWRQEREHKIISKYNKSLPFYASISPAWKQGIFLIVIFLFVLPFLFYLLLPAAIDSLKPEKTLVNRIDQVLATLDPEMIEEAQQTNAAELIPLKNALTSLQRVRGDAAFLCDPSTVLMLVQRLEGVKQLGVDAVTTKFINDALNDLNALQASTNPEACKADEGINALLSLEKVYQHKLNVCDNTIGRAPDLCANESLNSLMHDLQIASDPSYMMVEGTLSEEIIATLKYARIMARERPNQLAQTRIGQELQVIEETLDSVRAGDEAEEDVPDRTEMLNTWFKFVGLSGIVAVVTAVAAVDMYIGRINQHLPRPVCHSVSRLTRIVLREAKHSLKINGHFEQIEWEEAYRNPEGGIVLRGYLCPPLNGDPADQPKYIRAMRYYLYSDLWGHIVVAEGRSVRVSPSIHQAWEQRTAAVRGAELNRLFVNESPVYR
jgi:hypothetical protein